MFLGSSLCFSFFFSCLYEYQAKLRTHSSKTSFFLSLSVEYRDSSGNVHSRRTRACWMRVKKYAVRLYDRPTVPLDLKARMVKAEAVETLLYGSVTWTLRQEHYKKLRTGHHRVLLRIIGRQGRSRDHRILSYCKALQAANCESIETTVRTRVITVGGGGYSDGCPTATLTDHLARTVKFLPR